MNKRTEILYDLLTGDGDLGIVVKRGYASIEVVFVDAVNLDQVIEEAPCVAEALGKGFKIEAKIIAAQRVRFYVRKPGGNLYRPWYVEPEDDEDEAPHIPFHVLH